MKLSFIANIRMPTEKAHGVAVAKMCAAFALAGLEVELLVPMRQGILDKNPFEYYGVRENFKIKYLPCVDFLHLWWIPKIFSFLIEAASFSSSVKKYLASNPPEVIYSRDEFVLQKIAGKGCSHPLSLLHPAPARIASGQGEKIFWELHAIPKRWNLYKEMAAAVSGFVVLTVAMKKNLLEKGIGEEKILVAPDAVDLKSFEISKSKAELRRELGLPQDLKLITYVGRLETMGEEKGVGDLLRAFKDVKVAYPASALCLVGGPEEMIKEYRDLAKKLGLTSSIISGSTPSSTLSARTEGSRAEGLTHSINSGSTPSSTLSARTEGSRAEGLTNTIFIDYIEPGAVPAYELAADVLVMPFPWSEHYAYFMSPLKMFEYMAAGRPIVATDLPSVREILDDKNAVIVKPGDPADLARGILKLLRDEEAAIFLAENAKEKVKNYSWEERAKKILEFIK